MTAGVEISWVFMDTGLNYLQYNAEEFCESEFVKNLVLVTEDGINWHILIWNPCQYIIVLSTYIVFLAILGYKRPIRAGSLCVKIQWSTIRTTCIYKCFLF